VTTRWRVSVDPDRCIGSGTCEAITPEQFTLTSSRLSVATEALIEPDEAVAEAAEMCPAAAIVIDTVGDETAPNPSL
jgi:ferredoxin